jgi:hypothetical protein
MGMGNPLCAGKAKELFSWVVRDAVGWLGSTVWDSEMTSKGEET